MRGQTRSQAFLPEISGKLRGESGETVATCLVDAFDHARSSQRPLHTLLLAFGGLAGIILVYRHLVGVNSTTVALTLLLFILLIASAWGLRYAVVLSLAATACYNFFFLPPIGTFTIADPQNWLALFAFLVTAILASRLSQRARDQAENAPGRQRELKILFSP